MKNPFLHQDLDVKNELINLARSLRNEDVEVNNAAPFAAALLYANLADYLAANLLIGLQTLSEEATQEYMNGRVVIRQKRQLSLPLEKTTSRLKEYDFPSRDKILELLAEIRVNRNKIAHEIFKTPSSELGIVDAAMPIVCDKTEELIQVINAVYRDMPPATILDTIDLSRATEEIKNIKKSDK